MKRIKKFLIRLVRAMNCFGLNKKHISYKDIIAGVQSDFAEPVTELYIVLFGYNHNKSVFLGVPENGLLTLVNEAGKQKNPVNPEDVDVFSFNEFKRIVFFNYEESFKMIIDCPNPEGPTLELAEMMGQVWVNKV